MKDKILIKALSIFIIFVVSTSFKVDSQYVPISRRYPGIIIGNSNSVVTVQLVYDPTCGGTADLDQTMRSVINSFDQSTLNQITFKYAINALPYHINSYKLAQAIKYVNDKKGSSEALRCLRLFLDNISDWDEGFLQNISINQYLSKVASFVANNFQLSEAQIRRQISHYSKTDEQTRKWIKYPMGTLRAPGTPLMFINGALVDGVTDMTGEQIANLIKQQI